MKFLFSLYTLLLFFVIGGMGSIVSSQLAVAQTVDFCNFVRYGDDRRTKLGMKYIFGSLPDSIPHLPLAHSEEDFPIEYWLHIDIPEDQQSLTYQTVASLMMNSDLEPLQ